MDKLLLKPFSQACQNNRDAILRVIRPLLSDRQQVLEIGSGTGQHAVYFAEHLPQLHWQTSDLIENHEGINEWIEESERDNIAPPIELDVNHNPPLGKNFDAIFTANTLHIMDWPTVENCLNNSAEWLKPQGLLMVYGPFKYDGQFTSESNAEFDGWLKTHDAARGIRDFESVDALLSKKDFSLREDHTMPANNQLIVWQKNK